MERVPTHQSPCPGPEASARVASPAATTAAGVRIGARGGSLRPAEVATEPVRSPAPCEHVRGDRSLPLLPGAPALRQPTIGTLLRPRARRPPTEKALRADDEPFEEPCVLAPTHPEALRAHLREEPLGLARVRLRTRL